MPGSADEGKDWLLTQYLDIRPATVVDIGPGLGTYSMKFRSSHQAHWTGIEIYEPYVDWYDLRNKYDEIVIGDARAVGLPSADLYIAGDVIEHMPVDDAKVLIDKMKQAAKHLLISVPIIVYEQGEWGGNVHETHHYHWGHDEMIDVLQPIKSWAGEMLGAYRWDR
jgi:predicted TPR repeat methyltransferase